ncbi:MAG: TIGR00282 family metallophosphoesterase [Firmicutes bacterium]|nr:TIGR00282 family metallophosphoesterase [Bacillota bacterium]
MSSLSVLFIGDVVGTPGVRIVGSRLPDLIAEMSPNLVVANAENATESGRGIGGPQLEALYDAGVEMITLGNHAFANPASLRLIEEDARIVRPANFSAAAPGCGMRFVPAGDREVAVINLIGRTHMGLYDCPFAAADRLIAAAALRTPFIIVDMHAETTSEKIAMGWYLSGRVSAVLGTHTHVQTADERILEGHTAYITDVGMTGPQDGVLGMRRETVIKRFCDQLPARFTVADGPCALHGALVHVAGDGRATAIARVAVDELGGRRRGR